MGFFSNNAANQSKHATTTVIAEGCAIYGILQLKGAMQVDGLVEGKVNSESTLVISASGRIKGEVNAEKVIINGSFDGELYARSVEILPNGKAAGIIHSNDLIIEKGGSFRGETQPVAEEKLLQHEDDADDDVELRLENKTE